MDKWLIERVIRAIAEVSTASYFVDTVTKYAASELKEDDIKAIERLYEIVDNCAMDWKATMENKCR